jgi:hypothetical protein
MKVTAILPDDLIFDIQKYTKGKNITDSLAIALNEYLKIARIKKLNAKIEASPLEFKADYSATKIRNLNKI